MPLRTPRRHRLAPQPHHSGDEPWFRTEQSPTAPQQHNRWFAAFAYVPDESEEEGHEPVVPHADRFGEQASSAGLTDDLGGEQALGNEHRTGVEVHPVASGARAAGDV